jgi:hypothetical protein
MNFLSKSFSFFLFELEYIDDRIRNHLEKLNNQLKVKGEFFCELTHRHYLLLIHLLIQQIFVFVLENESVAIDNLSEGMIGRGQLLSEHLLFNKHGHQFLFGLQLLGGR